MAIGLPLAPIATLAQGGDARHAVLDELLDAYVRDGYVYYRALQSQRSRLSAYVAGLAFAPLDAMDRDDRVALWLNAYNALVLMTVIEHYPIAGSAPEYPSASIRQIPGAFERRQHRVGGQTLTLDQIEQTVLPRFGDPRVFLALGRGAAGSGRLRSEAFTGASLERQLSEAAGECAVSPRCVRIDRGANAVLISPIFSWREKEFSAAYAGKADDMFARRSPIERAVLAVIAPTVVPAEREFLAANAFQVRYLPFDWTLNDLNAR
jgi:hypothetical protein